MPSKAIICLTGTGNSFFAARRLQEALGYDAVILAPDLLRDPSLLGDPAEAGIVFPTYRGLPPLGLAPLMEDVLAGGAPHLEFFFAIATCAAGPGHSLLVAERLARDAGILTSYMDHVVMPSTYPANRPIAPLEDLRRSFAEAEARLSEIAASILQGDLKLPRLRLASRAALGRYRRLLRTPQEPIVAASDACVRCGRCVQVCPTGAVSLGDAGPVFGPGCESCMACYHFCPSHAIVLRRAPQGPPTYYPTALTGYDPRYR